jgi:signal transduction histidine kinase
VYTVFLDASGTPVSVASYGSSEDSGIIDDIEDIVAKAAWPSRQIGNLYLVNYAYSWESQYIVTVADLSHVSQSLRGLLALSILSGCVLEGLAWLLSRRLALYMSAPVKETLERQKQFVSDASHELKTPLAVILASAEAMEADPQSKWLQNIISESKRMNRLVNGLLDLSRSEVQTEPEELDLSKSLELSVLPYEGLLFENHLSLDLRVQPDIWVRADQQDIEQLVSILLDNAMKHSDPNQSVDVTLHEDGSEAVLEVTDTGDSIPTGEEEKIFERFYRADAARRRDENRYGLGLAIAKNIIHRLKGSISASSQGGKTTFVVRLKKARRKV